MERLSVCGFSLRWSVLYLAGLAAPALFGDSVTITDLGSNPGFATATTGSFASYINNAGDVAGYEYVSKNVYEAFYYDATTQTVTPFGTAFNGDSSPGGLNALGEVSGTSYSAAVGGTPTAFTYSLSAGVASLATLGGTNAMGEGVNDAGMVVGQSFTAGNANTHAFLYTPGGSPPDPEDLGTLGGSSATAYYINDAGQIAGNSNLSGDSTSQAFYALNGSSSLIPISLGGTNSAASAMNASGQVVGESSLSTGANEQAFLYEPGTTGSDDALDLGSLVTGGNSDATAINNVAIDGTSVATVVGRSDAGSGTHHAFEAVDVAGTYIMTDLGTLDGLPNSTAVAINDSGWIVGTSSSSTVTDVFLYEDGQMIDLSALAVSQGWQLLSVTGINDSGTIIGQGINGSGQYNAYTLNYSTSNPTPEPSTLPSMALGLGLCAAALYGTRQRLRR